MKIRLLLCLLVFPFILGAQTGRVAERVQTLKNNGEHFVEHDLFSPKTDSWPVDYHDVAEKVTRLEVHAAALNRVYREAPQFISLKIPFDNDLIEVDLYRQEVLTSDFYAKDHLGNIIDYQPGAYYRGIVSGDDTSIAAISIFENNIMGVVSTFKDGNIVIGKTQDGKDFLTYSDQNMQIENAFQCSVEEPEYFEEQIPPHQPQGETQESNCVKLYYEVAYAPYTQNNSDTGATIDWLTGIQNNISTLYANENVSMSIQSLKVWTEPDPYLGSYEDNLYMFQADVPTFDGDLAHLVNYPSTTSVAFLDSLCTGYNYAYSGIDVYYNQVPVYSWTILAMTHEMGHSLGSPHTHACWWNGDFTAIDGCAPYYDPSFSEGCSGPIPWGAGGTIMSYCHLVEGAGTNFANGFGTQPGTLIRDNVNSKYCLTTECLDLYNYDYRVVAQPNTLNGGTVEGGGFFMDGEETTVTAQSNPGFYFVNWTENGEEVSANMEYHFEIEATRVLTANFYSYATVRDCFIDYAVDLSSPEQTAVTSDLMTLAADFTVDSEDAFHLEKLYIPITGMVESVELAFYSDYMDLPGDLSLGPVTLEPISQTMLQPGAYELEIDLNSFNFSFGGAPGGKKYWMAVKTRVSGTGINRWMFSDEIHNETQFAVKEAEYSEWKSFSGVGDGAFYLEGSCGGSQEGSFFIGASATPFVGGMVWGGGFFDEGQNANLSAISHDNYHFTHWTENEEVVSTSPYFQVTADTHREFVAHFEEGLSMDKTTATKTVVYPNPFYEKIYLNTSGAVMDKIEIFDLRGRILSEFKPDANTYQISTEKLPPNQYLIRITTGKTVEVFQVIKK